MNVKMEYIMPLIEVRAYLYQMVYYPVPGTACGMIPPFYSGNEQKIDPPQRLNNTNNKSFFNKLPEDENMGTGINNIDDEMNNKYHQPNVEFRNALNWYYRTDYSFNFS